MPHEESKDAQGAFLNPARARLLVEGSKTVGTDWKPPVLEGWERPAGH